MHTLLVKTPNDIFKFTRTIKDSNRRNSDSTAVSAAMTKTTATERVPKGLLKSVNSIREHRTQH